MAELFEKITAAKLHQTNIRSAVEDITEVYVFVGRPNGELIDVKYNMLKLVKSKKG